MSVYVDGSDAPAVDDDLAALPWRLRPRLADQPASDKGNSGKAAEQVPAGGCHIHSSRASGLVTGEMITLAHANHHRGDEGCRLSTTGPVRERFRPFCRCETASGSTPSYSCPGMAGRGGRSFCTERPMGSPRAMRLTRPTAPGLGC